jgi:hypothetical protein
MGVVLALAVCVAFFVLAPLYGADSRIRDERDRRAWWPGSRGDR